MMKTFMVLSLISIIAAEKNPISEPSEVDIARMKSTYLVQHLWRNVSNPHFTTMVRQESLESTMQLITALESLSKALKEMQSPKTEEQLHYIYRWERIQAHSHGVHSLYETFMNFMKKQKLNQQVSSKRAWLDIAETILQDLPTAENIHRLILASSDKNEKNSTIFQVAQLVSPNLWNNRHYNEVSFKE